MVKETKGAASGSDGQDKKAMLPVSQRLSMAANKEEALEILKGMSQFSFCKSEAEC
jgi:hybrid polyketide synthase/nonribosomal peptide synthetase ACE1